MSLSSYNQIDVIITKVYLNFSSWFDNDNSDFPGYNPVWVDQIFNIAKGGVCTYFKNYLLFIERNIW